MFNSTKRWMLALAASALLPLAAAHAAETSEGVTISVQNAVGKVGEPTVIIARIEAMPGFAIAANHRNRVGNFSAQDQAVTFPDKMVRATVQEGALMFKVAVVPKKTGPNPINGVFRFAFVGEQDGKTQLDIKSAPLIATVTGKE
ncbi:MAG TPA: hypothetical protein VEY69_10370 [Lautropia sp.]|nr:hypothetical protein [Lautropia sp.]